MMWAHHITFTTIDTPLTINTHNAELQMVKVHINNTKHISKANICIPPRVSTSTHIHALRNSNHIHPTLHTAHHNIPHSVLTGDIYTDSTLWHSHTDDHRRQLITVDISNSDHITLNTNTPTRVPNTTLQHHHQISPRCQTHYAIGHRGQLNMHYHQTSYPSSPQLTYEMTTDYNKTDGHSPTTRKLAGHNSRKTHSFAQTTIPTNIHNVCKIVLADKHNIPKGKMHSNSRLLPEGMVCKSHKKQHKESKHL